MVLHGEKTSREHWFNADFDLSLRPRWSRLDETLQMARRISELQIHGLLSAGGGDSVRLEEAPPQEFLDEIVGLGVEPPAVTVAPDVRAEARLVPHGWNAEAAALNQTYDQPADHPPVRVVRKVNGRRFGAALEAEISGAQQTLGACTSVREVEEILRDTSQAADGWVVKAEHGNAALGNRRLRRRRLEARDLAFVEALLLEDDIVLLEPWHRRVLDLSVVFDVTADGRVVEPASHEVVNTADGAFIGAIFEPEPRWRDRWGATLEDVCHRSAAALAGQGYFGPVCLDAYVHETGAGDQRLRPLADLNARRHASAPARRLWPVLAPGRVFYWRFFTTRKLRLPTSGSAGRSALAGLGYDRDRRRGALRLSPLWMGAGSATRRPHKLAVAFVGDSRDEVLAQERVFREVFER